MTATTSRDAHALFAGPGEMRARCRELDWAATPLGPVERWPMSLRTTAGTLMASRNPMFLWWGPELVQIYNDAYRPSFGESGRHPRALGMRGRECWTDIWEAIGPQIEQVLSGGPATWHEDQHLPIERNGTLEDVWWTYGYSAVCGDDGAIAGVLVVCQETTARVLAERESARQAERTATADRRAARVLAQVSDEHLTMDADFHILDVNLAAERALDMPASALVGRTHWEAFPASVGSRIEGEYRRAMAERVEVHFTHHYVGEGYDRHLEIDAYPTDDGGLALFWRDISKRMRAEQQLRESEVRYRTLFESLDEGFCVIEVLFDDRGAPFDYRFVETNPAFELQTGLHNAVGRTVRELVPEHDQHWFDLYGGVVTTGVAVRFDAPAAAMGRHYDGFAFRLGSTGARTVAVLFTDTTAIHSADRERERLLADAQSSRDRVVGVLEAMTDGYVALNAEFVVTEVNGAMERYVGLARAAMLGNSLWELFPDTVGNEFEFHYRRAAEQRVAAHFTHEYNDGRLHLVAEVDAYPGPEGGVVIFWRNVTERARADAERAMLLEESIAARAEAEAANRAKAEFLAVMSHELRTPLNAIGGYADLLEMGIRGAVNDQQREDLRRIQNSQRHLLGLINEVLNYAKLETGTVHYDIGDVRMREALVAAESLVAPQARAKRLTLKLAECAPELSARADGEKLRQILVNLLSNAVKFTDSGGSISLQCVAQGDRMVLKVTDTGIGIPQDKLLAIFDPFVQVRADLRRPHEGTGLGLAISRDLARGMQGELSAESVQGSGSTFTLDLPLS